ncbi:acetate kinase [Chloroflexota bacterium]
MEVLTLNCGSSSVKYALLDMPAGLKRCHGIVQRVTLDESFIEHYNHNNNKTIYHHKCPNYASAVRLVIGLLTDEDVGVLPDISKITAIGHRVVHGGENFTNPTLIDSGVIKNIEKHSQLAPLHNPANLAGIRASIELAPDIPNVAIFDTAFFTTMPPFVYIYGLPYEWYEKYGIRKYGFHGTSHFYVSRRAAALLGKEPHETNMITLHIGNGVSITALKEGAAYDHSMGFTPLEGAVMGSRCGDIDPAIPLYVMKEEKLNCEDMENILNKRSGLLGISGKYIDRRDILAAIETGDKRAQLSFEIECYRLRKYIGAYTAALGRVDTIVFTGGVGEKSFLHRGKICEGLESLGIKIDDWKNKLAVDEKKEREISTPDSLVKVFVIPTDEEVVLAKEVFTLLKNRDFLRV